MSDKQVHLELIQGAIKRLSGNSFSLKEWTVALVTGLFALAAKDSNKFLVYLSIFPCFLFWVLDGYFLHCERLFRILYNTVRNKNEMHIDFSMEVTSTSLANEWLNAIFSKTLLIFYGAISVTIALVSLVVTTQ